jgi:hypothetical protein
MMGGDTLHFIQHVCDANNGSAYGHACVTKGEKRALDSGGHLTTSSHNARDGGDNVWVCREDFSWIKLVIGSV